MEILVIKVIRINKRKELEEAIEKERSFKHLKTKILTNLQQIIKIRGINILFQGFQKIKAKISNKNKITLEIKWLRLEI